MLTASEFLSIEESDGQSWWVVPRFFLDITALLSNAKPMTPDLLRVPAESSVRDVAAGFPALPVLPHVHRNFGLAGRQLLINESRD